MRFLITGVTGTIASFIAEEIKKHSSIHEVNGLSRDEYKQSQFKCEHIDHISLCDIRDYDRLKQVIQSYDVVIHTAALKHVDLMEKFPEESIKTNLHGTMNLCRLQREGHFKFLVLLSTDKAVEPINVYGMCKGISERLVLQNQPTNLVVRYGNVFNSRGSFVEKLIRQYLDGKMLVKLTDKDMTRFWITIQSAAKFIVDSIMNFDIGIKVPRMKASTLTQLVKAVEVFFDEKKVFKIEEIGLRPGEKMHEKLKFKGEHIASYKLDEEIVSNDPTLRMSQADLHLLLKNTKLSAKYL